MAKSGKRSDLDEQHGPCDSFSPAVSFLSRVYSSSWVWILSPRIYWICSQHIETNRALRCKARAASNAGPQNQTGRITLKNNSGKLTNFITVESDNLGHIHLQMILMMKIMEPRRGVWTHGKEENQRKHSKCKPDPNSLRSKQTEHYNELSCALSVITGLNWES